MDLSDSMTRLTRALYSGRHKYKNDRREIFEYFYVLLYSRPEGSRGVKSLAVA